MNTTKISKGLYSLTYMGRTFCIENCKALCNGDKYHWAAYEAGFPVGGECRYYPTKTKALDWTVFIIESDASSPVRF